MPKKIMPESEEIARVDFETLQQQLAAAVSGVQEVVAAVGSITAQLRAAHKSSSIGEQWVLTWGETLPKKAAAQMLGVSVNHLIKIIDEGGIKLTPDGRVLVRSAAEWANGAPAIRKQLAFRV